MTKAEVVKEIANRTGLDKADVLNCVEGFMEVVKDSLAKEENISNASPSSALIPCKSSQKSLGKVLFLYPQSAKIFLSVLRNISLAGKE